MGNRISAALSGSALLRGVSWLPVGAMFCSECVLQLLRNNIYQFKKGTLGKERGHIFLGASHNLQ